MYVMLIVKFQGSQSVSVGLLFQGGYHFGCSPLHSFNCFDISCEPWRPDGVSIFKEWSYQAFVKLGDDLLVSGSKCPLDGGEYSVCLICSVCYMTVELELLVNYHLSLQMLFG